MGRVALDIKKEELEGEITKLEAAQTFTNRSALCGALEKTKWALGGKDIKGNKKPFPASVLAQRIVEFGIQCKTPKGKKGGGNPNLGKHTKLPKKDRLKKHKDYYNVLNQLKYEFRNDKVAKKYLEKALNGSDKAFIALKCIECSGQTSEARKCKSYWCPLYLISPLVGKNNGQEEIVEGS